MTRELLQQSEHLVQAERVAAWRELARRLAHELKNPLFPASIDSRKSGASAAAKPGNVRGNLSGKFFDIVGGDWKS